MKERGTRFIPGKYTIILPGFLIGCGGDDPLPTVIFVATTNSKGTVNRLGGEATDCLTGDTEIAVETWSHDGVNADISFSFAIITNHVN